MHLKRLVLFVLVFSVVSIGAITGSFWLSLPNVDGTAKLAGLRDSAGRAPDMSASRTAASG